MKKMCAVLFVVFFAVLINQNQNIFGQDETYKFTLQTNPVLLLSDLLFFGYGNDSYTLFVLDLEGQYKNNNFINTSLGLSFIFYDDKEYEENVLQLNFKPMLIWRPFKTGLSGFQVGIYPNLGIIKYGYEGDNNILGEIGLGINLGYKWIFGNGFTLQLVSAFNRNFIVPEKPENSDSYFDNRDVLRILFIDLLELKMGYSF